MNIKGEKLRILSLAIVLLLALSSIVVITNNDGDNAYATPADAEDESGTTFGDVFKIVKSTFDMALNEVNIESLERIEGVESPESLVITEDIEIINDSYFSASSVEFKNGSKIIVKNEADLYILGDIDFIGKINIVFEGGNICVGNFLKLNFTEICSTDGMSIKFVTDNTTNNLWYLNFEVDVKGELKLVNSSELSEEIITISSADEEDAKVSEIRFSINFQLDEALYDNDLPINIIGFIDFIDGLVADKQSIPIVDLSVYVANLSSYQVTKINNVEDKRIIDDTVNLSELTLSLKTSSSGEYVTVDVSIDEMTYVKSSFNIDENDDVDANNSSIFRVSLDRVCLGISLTDKLSIDLDAARINCYTWERLGGKEIDEIIGHYSVWYEHSESDINLNNVELDVNTSVSNVSKIFSDPSSINAELDIRLSADISRTYTILNASETSNEPIESPKLCSDSISNLMIGGFRFNLSFDSNGSVVVDVSTNVQFSDMENDYEDKEVDKTSFEIIDFELKLNANNPGILESMLMLIMPSSVKDSSFVVNIVGMLLEDCTVKANIGFESILFNKVYETDGNLGSSTELAIGSLYLESGEKSVRIDVDFSSSVGKFILKPDIDLKIESTINKDTSVFFKNYNSSSGYSYSTAVSCSGMDLSASVKGPFDLMAFNGNPDRLSQVDVLVNMVCGKASVETRIIEPSEESDEARIFTNMDMTTVRLKISDDLYTVIGDLRDIMSMTIQKVDIISGNLDSNGNPDTSKTNHFVFRDGSYDEGIIKFQSFDVKSTIEEYVTVIESMESRILPVQYLYYAGEFDCNPVTPDHTNVSHESNYNFIFEVPSYSVRGGYFDTVCDIPAGVSIKVGSDEEGFHGWYINDEKYNAGSTIGFNVGDNVEILEVWNDQITVDLYVDGVKFATIPGKIGDVIEYYNVPSKENHTFDGWKCRESGDDDVSIYIVFKEGATYEAVYKELCKIEFYHVGEEEPFHTEYGSYGDFIKYSAPSIDGKTFDHWMDGEGGEKPGDRFYLRETPQKYYAIYEDLYSITFMIDGKEYQKIIDKAGTRVIPDNPKAENGFYFDGWYIEPEMTTKPTSFIISNEDVVYYGTFRSCCKITLSMNGETETFTGIPGEQLPFSKVRQFDGMRFVGMYSDAGFTTEVKECIFEDGDKTYYAKYEAMSKMILVVNGKEDVQWGVAGKIATVKDPVVDNYKFAGWYKDKDLKEKADILIFGEGETVYYAKMIATITVKFYVDGELYDSFTGDKETKYDVPDPHKSGFIFNGWYDNAEFKGEATIVGTFDISCDYYAKFVQVFEIKFVDGDKISYEYGTSGEQIDLPIPIGKEGYDFIRWYNGSVKVEGKITVKDSNEIYWAEYALRVTPTTEKKDGEITVSQPTSESISISKSDLNTAANNLGDDEFLKIILKNGTIKLPKGAVQKMNDSDSNKLFTLAVGTTSSILDRLSESNMEMAKSGILVSVDVINASSLSGLGKVLITIPYVLPEGMDAGDVAVYYINSNGDLEKHTSRYFVDDAGDGYVEFETDHFSDFVIGKNVSSSNDNTLIYVAVAAILVIAAVAVFFLYRKRQVA